MQRRTFARHMGRIQANSRHQKKAREALIRRARAITIIQNGKVVGWRMPDGGVVCVKHRYRTFESASVELARIKRVATHTHIPVRAYPCPLCRGFHLTSKPA